MEHTALRPKPMPGQDPGGGTPTDTPATAPRPHAARRRAPRLRAVLFALSIGTVLVLSGVGIGTVGATVIGMSKLADLQRHGSTGTLPPTSPRPAPSPAEPPARLTATLGVEAVDAERAGALVVGVHVPGPGFTAGLVRGDVLLACGGRRVDSAADLAHAVAHARPGTRIVLTVRHRGGGYQQLTAVPGVIT